MQIGSQHGIHLNPFLDGPLNVVNVVGPTVRESIVGTLMILRLLGRDERLLSLRLLLALSICQHNVV
jgi:hypothetical protein